MRLIYLLSSLSLVAGCGNLEKVSRSDWLSVEEVISKASSLDEQVITVKGWASIRNEDYGIWENKNDYEKRSSDKCISLLNFYSDRNRNKELDRNFVLITGTFSKDVFHDKNGQDVIRLGACSQFGIRFIEPDGLRKFSD